MVKGKDNKVDVVSQTGSKAGSVSLNADVFQAPVNKRLLHLVQVAYAANKRQGNASTKGRKEVRGGGAKPWKQKGTGRARAGSNRSPLWRGGGTTFGPKPRSYRVNLPKTMRIEALRCALSLKFKESKLTVIDELNVNEPKTKLFAAILNALKFGTSKTLCIAADATENLKRASRNVENTKLTTSATVTAYDILRKKNLVIAKSALPLIEKRFCSESNVAAPKETAKKTKEKELTEVK
jgi:large subunit ribosomal protein L4